MKENEILEEIRRGRDQHARECDYDVHRVFEEIRKGTEKLRGEGWQIVSPEPRVTKQADYALHEHAPERSMPGRRYTRAEIAKRHGGGAIEFLPHVANRIVCACLRPDFNPDAPKVILVGTDPDVQRWASVLCQQKGPIPVYLRRQTNAWEYVGDFEVERWSQSPTDITEHELRSGRGGEFPVSKVIYMKEAR